MIVKGMASLDVIITKEEAFKGLCKEIGVYEIVFDDTYDTFYNLEKDENGNDYYICKRDMSQHGSCRFAVVEDECIRNPKDVEIITHLCALKKLLDIK